MQIRLICFDFDIKQNSVWSPKLKKIQSNTKSDWFVLILISNETQFDLPNCTKSNQTLNQVDCYWFWYQIKFGLISKNDEKAIKHQIKLITIDFDIKQNWIWSLKMTKILSTMESGWSSMILISNKITFDHQKWPKSNQSWHQTDPHWFWYQKKLGLITKNDKNPIKLKINLISILIDKLISMKLISI